MTADARIGTTLQGKYAIERVLGEGGMGIVYAARHVRLDRPVAIKFLHAPFARDRAALARFEGEARAAGSLRHPNVVDVVDVDFDDAQGAPFMVLELLHGESLASLLRRRGALPAEEALALIDPVLDALEAAHARGIVHRDLKPDNIFVASEAGRTVPKLLDFGIAKLRDGAGGVATATGTALGTPTYMAPEQARGLTKELGPWTDVWSMGVVLFECVSGRMHFDFEPEAGTLAWLGMVATGRPHALRDVAPAVPEVIAAAIDGALEVDASRRTPDIASLRAALRGEPAPVRASVQATGGSDVATPIPVTRAISSSGGGGRRSAAVWAIGIAVAIAAIAVAAGALGALSGGAPVVTPEIASPAPERDTRAIATDRGAEPAVASPDAPEASPATATTPIDEPRAARDTATAAVAAARDTATGAGVAARDTAAGAGAAARDTATAGVAARDTGVRGIAAEPAGAEIERARAGEEPAAPRARGEGDGDRTGRERTTRTRSGEWRVEDL